MSVTVFIPTALRAFTERKSEINVGDVATVEEAIRQLTDRYPAIADYVFASDGQLKRFINVFIGEENIKDREGIKTALKDGDKISLIPAIAGGADE